MCLYGIARTLTTETVQVSIEMFLSKVGARGLESTGQPDLFAYLARIDDVAYADRPHLDGHLVDIERAMLRLNVVSYGITSASEVDELDMDTVLPNEKQCFRSGFWIERSNLQRSLNQLVHMQKCLELIIQYETTVQRKYDSVIVARPDIVYDSWRIVPGILDPVAGGKVVHWRDWFMALPRDTLPRLLPGEGPVLLRCLPGERCCNTVTRSEGMFEHLTGVNMESWSKSCMCTLLPEQEQDGVEYFVGDVPSTHR